MEQSVEYSSLKNLLQHSNQSGARNVSMYSFDDADDMIMVFWHDFQKFGYVNVILLGLYLPIFIVALVGNLLVIVTLSLQELSWRAKHIYLLNLAISDLLVTLICMPCTVATIIYRLWLSGLALCKLAPFLQSVAVATGIFTLTGMSVDRYMFIQHSSNAHWSFAPVHAVLLTAITWTLSAVFMAPQLYVRTIETMVLPDLTNITFCIEKWPADKDRRIFGWLLLFVVYVIPVTIVAVCYANVGKMLCSYTLSRDDSNASNGTYIVCRKRAARLIILLVVLFVCSWLPYNVMSLLIDQWDMSALVPFLPFALWLGYAHSAVNPALYWATNRSFREMVAKLCRNIRCPRAKKKRRPRRY